MMDKLEIQRSKYIVLAKSFKFFLVFLLCSFSFALFTSETFAQAQQAILSLSPSDGSINRGCNFSLEVKLNTDGAQTDGTDAILIYDPSRFSATSIISGTIYPDFPGNNIDQQNGKITISGLASVTQAFTGQGTLATINFRAQDNAPTGVAQVNFDFDPINKAKTTDSNVVQRGTVADILNSVVNGNYTIGTGSCSASGPGVTGSTGTTGTTGITGGTPGLGNQGGSGIVGTTPSGQIIYKTLPQGGTQELTATLVIVGSILTIFGILGLALL